jgi:hypothetical protein
MEHDPGFGKVYIEEIREVLYGMTAGDPLLLEKCRKLIRG